MNKESMRLAYIVMLQTLSPRQRAVFLLREVIGLSASETAEVTGDSVAAVNSALQRARAAVQAVRTQSEELRLPVQVDPLVERYVMAHDKGDAGALIAILGEEVELAVSPVGVHLRGKPAVATSLAQNMASAGNFRSFVTTANGQPAVAHYLRRWDDDVFRAFSLVVLGFEDDQLIDFATFLMPQLFQYFGLPDELAIANNIPRLR